MRAFAFVFAASLALLSCSAGPTTSTKCGPTTCSGCCDLGGNCQAGATSVACGAGGATCAQCPGAESCTFGLCSGAATGGGTATGGSGGASGGGSGTGGSGGGNVGGGSGMTPDAGPQNTCAGTLVLCGTRCLDLQAEVENCGTCGHACGQGQVCNRGTCAVLPNDCTTQAQGCGAGYFCDPISKKCMSGCRLSNDCPSGATCNAGTCECATGQHACGQACVTDTAPASCGSRCSVCPQPAQSTSTCAAATCGFTCNTGYMANAGACLDIDECATANGGCSPNAACTNTPGARTCTCNTGYTGSGVSCTDVNECLANNGGCDVNATCANTLGARTCTCASGFTGNGQTCADVNECQSNNGGCNVNATCTNTPGARTCACNAGFSGNGLSCTPSSTGGGGGTTGGGGGTTGGGGGTTGTVSDQITQVRAAIDATTTGTVGQLTIRGAYVSYLKPAVAGATLGNDPVGFFIQGSQAGPALFIAVDPATVAGGLAPGNLVDITVDTVSRINQVRVVTGISGVTRSTTTPNPIPGLIAAAGTIDFAAATTLDTFESRLISLSASVVTDPVNAGTSFKSVTVSTTGTIGASAAMKLRMPSTEMDALNFGVGCSFTVSGVPMWRYTATSQPSPFVASEVQNVTCPGPSPLSAAATSTTSATVSFSRDLSPATVTAGAFSITAAGGGSLAVLSATPVSTRGVALTTATQVSSQTYTVAVTSSVQDTRGTGVPSTANSTTFLGAGTGSCFPGVVISQFFGGGSATGPFNQDFVELHNRGAVGVDLTNWSLQYQSTAGTTWTSNIITTGVIAPGGYFLVALGAPAVGGTSLPTPDLTINVTGTTNLSGTAAKLALVSSAGALPTGCPTSTAWTDLVSYGAVTSACAETASAPTPGQTLALFRLDGTGGTTACVDTNNNAADFITGAPAPRTTLSSAASCTCP